MNIHDPITSEDDPRFISAKAGILEMAQNRPAGGYNVIYIDYPWLFNTRSEKGKGKSADKHYPCISTELLCKLPVEALASNNCVLIMWCTWPLIFHAELVIESTGFEYSGLGWEWIKKNPVTGKFAFGGGYGTRKNLEPCLISRKGKPFLKSRSERDFLFAPRREHSRKPVEAYEKIERMYDGPYIELFGRERREGWDVFGNEVDKFVDQDQ